MSGVIIAGDTSGSITLSAPAVAGASVLTLPVATDTLVGKATTDVLTNKTLTSPTISGAVVSSMGSSILTSGTAVASTSGTSIDFTDIPSWVKRVTVMFNGVSTNGTSKVLVQIGDSGGIETSGYLGSVVFAEASDTATNLSSGFITDNTANATGVRHGALIISQVNASAFSWVCFGNIGRSDLAAVSVVGGSKALSAALDRVRITTVNGTDTFDAGSINIMYE
jgi:hypothetical protein